MIRTIGWFIFFWSSLIILIPSILRIKYLKKKGKIEKSDKLVDKRMKSLSDSLLRLSGCEVEVEGEENIPKDRNVLFVSNHQSNFDIPVLVRYLEKPKGFVAKKELGKVPLLSSWMKAMHCIFMDRDNARESIRAIKDGINLLKEGYSLVLFPEGTRSEDGNLGEFKSGGLRLAAKSKVDVVPITIEGTKSIMKKSSLIIRPAKVKVTVSPIIKTEEYKGDTKKLTKDVRNIIFKNLKK